jgi:hypothetical protein
MTSPSVRPERSYRTPAEHATASDPMRAGVISCPPEAPLRQVAQMMATEHIHCVVGSRWVCFRRSTLPASWLGARRELRAMPGGGARRGLALAASGHDMTSATPGGAHRILRVMALTS